MEKRFTTPSFAFANDTPPRRGTVPLLWRGRGGIITYQMEMLKQVQHDTFFVCMTA
ncbi:MAG: hypothetical protein FWG85_06110 [Bacteroidetes bacterium]|nr:hypothetical protein [Bacteroidota bacterium]